jgi:hypothetical protein
MSSAAVLTAPLFVKSLKQLVGFVDERANAIARGIFRRFFKQRSDEPVRAESRHEEGSGPNEWIDPPKSHSLVLLSHRRPRRISAAAPLSLTPNLDRPACRSLQTHILRWSLILGQKADCVGSSGEDKTAAVDVHDVDDGTGKERYLIHDAQDSSPSAP